MYHAKWFSKKTDESYSRGFEVLDVALKHADEQFCWGYDVSVDDENNHNYLTQNQVKVPENTGFFMCLPKEYVNLGSYERISKEHSEWLSITYELPDGSYLRIDNKTTKELAYMSKKYYTHFICVVVECDSEGNFLGVAGGV